MNITNFFQHVLGAPLINSRWSWGAVNEGSQQLFLRVWSDHFDDTKEFIQVDWEKRVTTSQGYDQRTAQLRRYQSEDLEAYGVVCDPRDPPGEKLRKIARFDSETLLRLGELKVQGGTTWARVVRETPVSVTIGNPTKQDAFADVDLGAESLDEMTLTEKEALAKARVGQGKFRQDVLAKWDNQCAVSRVEIRELLRASHIKPWKDSTSRERLDPCNGVPLIATLDALFDYGYISFDDSGKMLISPLLNKVDCQKLGITRKRLRIKPDKKMKGYLEYHRSKIFRSS
jgi:hypothetical protein